ncbi:MAG: tRNA glutamyl-Q(34) synthetase GluQRS [Betaproteobacteria bacterium]
MSTRYCGRFAPTPSGPLHFGSLVAALGSYLEAKTLGGTWRVRIDDLDPLRVAPGASDDILRTLESLGMMWDGAVLYQSDRTDAYRAALLAIAEVAPVYSCVCSRREIAAAAIAGIEGPIYPGTCRSRVALPNSAYAMRLNVRGAHVRLDDALQGPQIRDLERESGDFVLYRADGSHSFHLAAAVDDGEQAITDVVRGADLLESSARQIHLQHLLGLPTPRYVHLPVAVDRQNQKLSKQTRAQPIDAATPVSTLCRVLKFLHQPVLPGLERADLHAFWQHAIAVWQLDRVGARMQAPAPDA